MIFALLAETPSGNFDLLLILRSRGCSVVTLLLFMFFVGCIAGFELVTPDGVVLDLDVFDSLSISSRFFEFEVASCTNLSF